MLWNESAALLTDSMAMQGRNFINDTLGDSPALRLTVEHDRRGDGMSLWDDDRDEMSVDMLTDVDEEEMDEEVRIVVVSSKHANSIIIRCKKPWTVY